MTFLKQYFSYAKLAIQQLSFFAGLSFLVISFNIQAEDEILSLEGARIRGNQELPNVLYLIPWKAPKVYRLDESDNVLSIEPQFDKLERGSFKRLISYHETFKTSDAQILDKLPVVEK